MNICKHIYRITEKHIYRFNFFSNINYNYLLNLYIINYTQVYYNSIYTYIGTGTFVTGALVPVFVEFVAQHQVQFYLHWYIMYLAIPKYMEIYMCMSFYMK